MAFRWFPTPPPVSPSASPALGVGLCFNTLLAAAAILAHDWFAPNPEPFVQDLVAMLVPAYAALCLSVAVLYGIAGAAWTGWSWWRVPIATLAAASVGWVVNVLGMSWWASRQGWNTSPAMTWGSEIQKSLVLAVVVGVLVLVAIWSTLLSRRFTFGASPEASDP